MVKQNNKSRSLNSKKPYMFILVMITILMFSGFSAVFSVTQHNLLEWQFETGSGSLTYDSSGNSNTGLITGATWDNTNTKFGNYALSFDGNNDYVTSVTSTDTPTTLGFSVWVRPTKLLTDKYIFDIDDTNEIHELEYNINNNTLEYGYINDNLNYTHFTIPNVPLTIDTWTHLVIGIDITNDTISVYKDNNFIGKFNVTDGINKENTQKTLRLGINHDLTGDWNGQIDSFYIFDFMPNSTQIADLYNSNTISLYTEPINNNTDNIVTEHITLINDTYPNNNANVNLDTDISFTLNEIGSCELYIDKRLTDTKRNVLTGVFDVFFDTTGNHSYQLNCWFEQNNTRYYDVTDLINLNVQQISKSIDFYLYAHNDSLLYGENLYITTPCMRESFGYYGKEINDDREFYIKKLVNGHTNLDLNAIDTYKFCLIRGQINIDNNTNYNTNYDIVEINKQINLGNITINENSKVFGFKLDENDLYKVYEPSFWGKTWGSIFNIILGLIVGSIIIMIGVTMNYPRVIIAGAVIILASMGLEIAKLFAGLV